MCITPVLSHIAPLVQYDGVTVCVSTQCVESVQAQSTRHGKSQATFFLASEPESPASAPPVSLPDPQASASNHTQAKQCIHKKITRIKQERHREIDSGHART